MADTIIESLQEYLQAYGAETARYTVIGKEGKDNAPRFTVRVQAENESAVGEGGSVREAEKQAAQRLLAILKDHRGE